MSLLDDALKTAGHLPATDDVPADKHVTVTADLSLAGAEADVNWRVAQSWAVKGWVNATWDGNRAAGVSLKGSW